MIKFEYRYDLIKKMAADFLDESEKNWHDVSYIMDWERRVSYESELQEAITDLYMNSIRAEFINDKSKGFLYPGLIVEYMSLKDFVEGMVEQKVEAERYTY